MANIAIFRQAKANQISSYNHLVNIQDFTNQNKLFNSKVGYTNIMFTVNDNGEYSATKYIRDGKNQHLITNLKKREDNLDKLSRDDYKSHKLKEKVANPTKRVRTVLQSKDLRKEFIIALGGDKKIKPWDFANKVKATVDAVMEKKGLDRRNVIGIFIHADEKTLHAHISYNDFSFKYSTTASQLGRFKIEKGMSRELKSEVLKLQRAKFAEYQDLVAEKMGMQRGEVNSRAKHTTKAQFYDEKAKEVDQFEIKLSSKTQELEEIKKAVEDVRKSTSAEINALANSKKQFQAEYNTFEDNLKRELRGLIEIKNQIRINSNMPFLPTPEVNLDILLAGLNTELGLNWKLKDLEKIYTSGQYCLQKLSYPDLPKLIKNAEGLTKKINEKLERENVLVKTQRTR